MLVVLAMSFPAARADSHLDDRFSISLGVFVANRDVETQLNGTTESGTKIDFENDLGLSTSVNVFRIDGYYRFNSRHRLNFSFFDLSRSGSRQIQTDIQWGDSLFTIDTVIEADSDFKIYKAAYTYSFLQREKGYMGATIGFYVADTRIGLSVQGLSQDDVGSITAPLPVIGLRGQYELSDRWTFRASGEFFFVEFDGIEGSLTDVYAALDYALNDSISLGLGVNSVAMDFDSTASGFQGSLKSRYTGALLFLKFDF